MPNYTPAEADALLGPDPGTAATPSATPGEKFDANSADAFLGPAPAQPQAPDPLSFKGVALNALGAIAPVMRTPGVDTWLANSGAGRVLDAMGVGATQNWGEDNLGLSDQGADALKKAGIFNDVSKGQISIVRAFNEGLIRPAAIALDAANRAASSAYAGVQAGVMQAGTELGMPEAGRTLAEIPDAFMGSPHMLEAAKDAHAVGQPEGVYMGTQEAAPEKAAAAPVPTPAEAAAPTPAPEAPPEPAPPPADVHEAARQIAPDVFAEYDPLQAHVEALRQQIADATGDLQKQAEAQVPNAARISELEGRLAEADDPKKAAKYQEWLDGLTPARDEFVNSGKMALLTRDTPEIAAMRQELQEADYRLRDLAPDVTAAYGEAAKQFPVEEAAPAEVAPAPEPAPQAEQAPVAKAPNAEAAPAVEAAKPAPVADIAADVSQKLQAAGRPAEEADAAGQVTKALWETRAERFGGAKGTAEEMYAREAPDIRAGKGAKVAEFAQPSVKATGGARAVQSLMHSAGFDSAEKLSDLGERMARSTKVGGLLSGEADISVMKEMRGAAVKNGKVLDSIVRSVPVDVVNNLFGSEGAAKVALHHEAMLKDASAFDTNLSVSGLGDRAKAVRLLLSEVARRGAERSGVALSAAGESAESSSALRAGNINSLYQGGRSKNASITFMDDGRSVIKLFANANASSFLHEMGHDWLERLDKDGIDPAAPGDLKQDRAAVRQYLGLNEGDAISTKAHEKFARSFERYMMEGRAPSTALANVFGKFRQWLTTIYQTVAKLRAPITDDIRDVFDRLLAKEPERQPAIVPETAREAEPPIQAAEPNPQAAVAVTGDLAGLHEQDAATTEPKDAAAVADQVRKEVDKTAQVHAPEVADEFNRTGSADGSSGGAGGNAAEAGNPGNDGDQAGSAPGEAGSATEPGTVNAGGSDAAAEGAGASSQPGPEPLDLKGEAQDFRTKDDREIEKAANIRLDKINGSDDMNAALRQLAEQNGDFMDARYGTAAYRTQLDIRNTRILLRSATSDMMEAAVKAATGDPAAIADWVTKQKRAAMIFDHLSTLSADWAHAGHELNKVMDGWDQAKWLAQQMESPDGKTLFQLQQQAAALASKMETAEQAGKFAADMEATPWQKFRNGLVGYYVNALISGPITHMAYAVGNETMMLYRMGPETAVAAAVGAIRRDADRVYLGEVGAQFYGHLAGARAGIMPAVEALKTGISRLPGMDESAASIRPQSIPGKVGYVLETPSRVVTAIHTLFYTMNYSAEIARQAYREASSKGLSGFDFDAEVARLKSTPTPEMMEQAQAAATRSVLMRGAEGYQKKVADLANYNPPSPDLGAAASLTFKLAVPFMQIGMNILQEGLVERTPLSLLSGQARAELSGSLGGAARDLRIAKIATGSMLAAAAYSLAAEGIISGGDDPDPKKRAVAADLGQKAYSIRVLNTNIPYRKYLGPLGPLVAAAADFYQIGHKMDDETITKVGSSIAFAFSEVVADESWMAGVSNFVQAATNWDTDGERWLRSTATSFLPFSSAMNQTARLVDPYQRQARTMLDAVANKIPGASEELAPQIGLWGQPVGGHMMISPSQARQDPVDQRLQALDRGFAPVQRKILGVPLTDGQYADYARISGMQAHMSLTALVNAPGFTNLPADDQFNAMTKVRDAAIARARALIQLRYPDITKQAIANKQSLNAAR